MRRVIGSVGLSLREKTPHPSGRDPKVPICRRAAFARPRPSRGSVRDTVASGLLGAATLRGTERALCSPLATFVYCRRVCTLWRLALFRCMVRFVSFPVRHWQCDSLPGCVPCGHLHQQTTTSHSVARTQPQPPLSHPMHWRLDSHTHTTLRIRFI